MRRGGKRYYITFVDDCSRFTRVYLLGNKDKATEYFIKYRTEVANQSDWKIKRVRSDREKEYDATKLKLVCEQNGIIHETTASYTPEENGITKPN